MPWNSVVEAGAWIIGTWIVSALAILAAWNAAKLIVMERSRRRWDREHPDRSA